VQRGVHGERTVAQGLGPSRKPADDRRKSEKVLTLVLSGIEFCFSEASVPLPAAHEVVVNVSRESSRPSSGKFSITFLPRALKYSCMSI
jgi:hypothetical protein